MVGQALQRRQLMMGTGSTKGAVDSGHRQLMVGLCSTEVGSC